MAATRQIKRGSIYIDKRLLKMAKFLADGRDSTMADEVERRLWKSMEPDYRKAIAKEHELGENGAG